MINISSLQYTARVMLAVSMTLFCAYWMQVESPGTAATTVLIVSSPIRGAVLSKSFWRFIGSVIGAIAAVTLMAVFAQSPFLFVIGVAVWLGICSGLSSLLRYFRGYSAVLAGYTVTLVVFGALDKPETVFHLALTRLADITLGLVCSALVFMITAPSPGRRQLSELLHHLVQSVARLINDALSGATDVDLYASRHLIANQIAALDQAVEYATAEDAGVGRFAGELRLAAANLFGAAIGGLRAATLLRDVAPTEAAALADALSHLTTEESPQVLRLILLKHRNAFIDDMGRDVVATSAVDQASTLLEQFIVVLDAIVALKRGVPHAGIQRLPLFVNTSTALRNALRGSLAMLLAGIFWIESYWPAGNSMLLMLGPVCGLMALSDSASAASVAFLKGMCISVVIGFICTFIVLPQMSGFPLLLVGALPFVAVGVYLSTNPRYTALMVGYVTFLFALISPDNAMRFDMIHYLNVGFAFIMASAIGALSFRVLVPPSPLSEAAFLARSVRRDLAWLARHPSRYSLGWEHLQHQKLIRLSRRLANFPQERVDALHDGEEAVLIGRRLGQLGQALRDKNLPASVMAQLREVMPHLKNLMRLPDAAAYQVAVSADHIAAEQAGTASLHIAAALYDLATLLRRRAGRRVVGLPIADAS